jgi:subtilisin-like proprotein convertase family protein
MKISRIQARIAILFLLGFSSRAAVFDFPGIDRDIPEADDSGVVDSRTISTSTAPIDEVRVTLNISGTGSGGFNGDLYASLQYETGFAVLLNRVGSRAGNSSGYSDSGLNVTFDDHASNGDIHVYRLTLSGNHDTPLGGPLSGTWAPDARTADPSVVVDTSSRTEFLSSFSGLNPNGDWTLFVADLESGGTSRLSGWSLDIASVPEPLDGAMLAALCLLAFAIWRGRRCRRRLSVES